jgi:hypothetical protein
MNPRPSPLRHVTPLPIRVQVNDPERTAVASENSLKLPTTFSETRQRNATGPAADTVASPNSPLRQRGLVSGVKSGVEAVSAPGLPAIPVATTLVVMHVTAAAFAVVFEVKTQRTLRSGRAYETGAACEITVRAPWTPRTTPTADPPRIATRATAATVLSLRLRRCGSRSGYQGAPLSSGPHHSSSSNQRWSAFIAAAYPHFVGWVGPGPGLLPCGHRCIRRRPSAVIYSLLTTARETRNPRPDFTLQLTPEAADVHVNTPRLIDLPYASFGLAGSTLVSPRHPKRLT